MDDLTALLTGVGDTSVDCFDLSITRADDAAISDLQAGQYAFSTDFFAPIVDDAYDWGYIGAMNAMSDVFASGAIPVMATSIMVWPTGVVPVEMMRAVLNGCCAALTSVGCSLGGGHTISGDVPLFGLSVVGQLVSERALTNEGGSPRDVLVLTKPLGTGVICSAAKAGLATRSELARAVEVMKTSNLDASRVCINSEATSVTDVSGFGLVGHAAEIARASGVTAELCVPQDAIIAGTLRLLDMDVITGGGRRNRRSLADRIRHDGLSNRISEIGFDPQTSGGLLLAAKPETVPTVVSNLNSCGSDAFIVGRLIESIHGIDVVMLPES